MDPNILESGSTRPEKKVGMRRRSDHGNGKSDGCVKVGLQVPRHFLFIDGIWLGIGTTTSYLSALIVDEILTTSSAGTKIGRRLGMCELGRESGTLAIAI